MNSINKVNTTYKMSSTRRMVFSALLIALVFVATKFINIRLPISINGGLIHLGTAMLYIISMVFGPSMGAISGAFGMAIFDAIDPTWFIWAPFTFVIRGIMGLIVGSIIKRKVKKEQASSKNTLWSIAAMLVGGIWMIAGYYISDVILYGNWIAALTSIPGDSIQVAAGIIIALPLATALKKTGYFEKFIA